MSLYTTGEIAKLCNVSVRTVQYYDARGILIPSDLTEGGRRLYTEDDVIRLKVICFMRDIGISVDTVGKILADPMAIDVIDLLLERQEEMLKDETEKVRKKLEMVSGLRKALKSMDGLDLSTVSDMAVIMKDSGKLKKMRWMMILTGLPVTALEWWGIISWIRGGGPRLFLLYLLIAIPWGIAVSIYYMKHTAYICPECHRTFRPGWKENFFANHTPNTRKLVCPDCGHKNWCVEIWAEEMPENGQQA